MAGREKRGVDAAEADLFQGRPYVLTPRADAELHTPMARELAPVDSKDRRLGHYLEPGRARPNRRLP